MKITILQIALSAAFAASLYAGRARGQDILDRPVSLSVKNTKISKVIFMITKQTGVKFLFSPEGINADRKLDCHVADKKLKDFLDEILEPLHIGYKVLEKKVLLYASGSGKGKSGYGNSRELPADASAGKIISGTIVNEKEEPVSNASISINGKSGGTSTDAKGNFSISIPGDIAMLIVSHVGYATQEINAGVQDHIRIVMQPVNKAMDDVVVIGYGQQKKSDLTGSISTVSPKDFEKQPIIRFEDALKGRAAGVVVQTPNGAPGAGVKIRVRGANSINGNNDPLYVIDGFIGGDIITLNPNDIASIEILKDASATAIFGSRGANGVVIITTKKGVEGKSQIGLDVFYSVNKVSKTYHLLDGAQYMQTINEQNAALGLGPQFTDAAIGEIRKNGGTDWQDAVLQTGATQNDQLSYSGGSEKTKIYLSGSIADQKGIIINSWYRRYGLRANINTTFSKKFNFSFNVSGTYQKARNNYNYNGRNTPYGEAIVFSPNIPIFDTATGDYTKSPAYGPVSVNPVFNAREWIFDGNAFTVLSNLQLNYKITEAWQLLVSGGVNGYNYNNPYLKRYYPGALIGTTEAGYDNGSGWSYQNTNMLSYQKTLNDIHKLNVSAIYEQQVSISRSSSSWATDFPTISQGYNNLALGGTQKAGSGYSKWSLQSYLGRLNYTLMDKYLFTITFRADGSSKFRGKNKYGYFPSAAFAWKLSEEPFIRDLGIFNDLKIRSSYGLTGSQAIQPYQTLNVLAPGRNYPFNGHDLAVGIGPGDPGNPNLKWESTAQADIGLDVGLFNGRLTATADYYYKKTKDLLLYVTIPDYNGGGSILSNVGSMQNKGFELLLNGILINKTNLKVNTSINLSAFRNKVLNLGDNDEIFINGGYLDIPVNLASPYIIKVDQPLGGFRGLIFEGLWQEKDASEAALFGNKPGDSRYRDLDGNHVIDGNDMTNIGNALPRYTWGLSTNIEFYHFDLNIFINGVSGNQVWNYTKFIPMAQGGDVKNPTSADILRHWTPTNTNTDIPAFSKSNVTYAQSSKYIESGSFIRLSNLTLGYNLPDLLLRNIKLFQARFYISAQNLFIITRYSGLDPELSTTPVYSDVTQGIDNATYPPFKTYTIGLKITL